MTACYFRLPVIIVQYIHNMVADLGTYLHKLSYTTQQT